MGARRAIILAGGKGTRLRPYSIVLPKPLVPIVDYPILEIVIRQLVRQGFGHITLAVNHLADVIKSFFGDGSRWGVRIDYSLETIPLSTIAPLALIPDLPEDFLLMNGDVLTDLDFVGLLGQHEAERSLFTIAASEREEKTDYGVLEVGPDGLLTGFAEKPVRKYLVSMGVYAVSRQVLSMIPTGVPYGFDNLMRDLLDRGERVRVRPYGGYWNDIGRPDDYERAVEDFPTLRGRLRIDD